MRNSHSKSYACSTNGSSVGGRLARAAGRPVLWGCVLLLIIRGIASEFSAPQKVTTTRGVTGTVSQPVYPAQKQEGR